MRFLHRSSCLAMLWSEDVTDTLTDVRIISIRQSGVGDRRFARKVRKSTWNDGGCLDLDSGGFFDEAHDLDRGHRRVMRADHLAVDSSKRLRVG